MKKLLILAPPIPPNHLGGDGKFAYDIAKELFKEHTETILFSPVYNGKYEDIKEKSGLRNIRIPILGSYDNNWDFPIWVPQFAEKRDKILLNYLKKLNLLDGVWIHEIGGSIYNNLLTSLKKGGFNYSCHMQFVLENYDKNIPNKRTFKRMTVLSQKNLVKNASLVFFLSRYDFQPYRKDVANFRIIPNGVDLTFYKSRLNKTIKKNKKFSIFIGGRLHSPMKGASKIFPIIKRSMEKRDIIINVCAPDVTYLSLLGSKNSASIKYHGWKSVYETQKIIQRSHIAIFASIYEPFGLLAIESLANRVPVISTKTGGLLEIVKNGKNGYFIDLNEPDVIVKLIVNLIDNPMLVKTLARNTWLNLERFDIKKIANTYIKNLSPFLVS